MAVNITGYQFYDGVIEGVFFVPSWFAEKLNNYGIYNLGFWLGIIIFLVIIWIILFGLPGYDPR